MALQDPNSYKRGNRFENNEPDFVPSVNKKSATHDRAELYNKNNWANINDTYLISPIYGGDGRILVKEDPPSSKFDCSTCKGKGHTSERCNNCNGTGRELSEQDSDIISIPCRACTIGERGGRKSYGYKLCPACSGKGGLIVIPEEAQKNTTMGTVVAVSKDGIKILKVNDRVIYTNYTGTQFRMLDIDMRVIIEKDILGKIKQLKTSADVLEQGTYADLENTGVPHE